MAMTFDTPVGGGDGGGESVDFPERLAGARLVLVTPHPDDESLALGGLIQHAVRQGADVTVVQVTDGDNNPWPQRWLERRWRIGSAERRRWGERRAQEMLQAMHCLGLDATSRRRLGWPDLGVTARLQETTAEALGEVVDILRDANPDMVVLPALADSHPDHSACHVLVRLALQRLQLQPVSLAYHVHGKQHDAGVPVVLELDATMRENKRRAILAHYTQVALARRRLLAKATATEVLDALPARDGGDGGHAGRLVPERVRLPWDPPRVWHPWLQITLAHPDGACIWRWRDAPLVRDDQGLWLDLPVDVRQGPVFAKLQMRCASPWIFDHWGWCDLTAPARPRQAVSEQGQENPA